MARMSWQSGFSTPQVSYLYTSFPDKSHIVQEHGLLMRPVPLLACVMLCHAHICHTAPRCEQQHQHAQQYQPWVKGWS